MNTRGWGPRDGIKGDAAIEDSRRAVERAMTSGAEPSKWDAWLGRVRSEVAELGAEHEEPALLLVLAAVLAIIDREMGKVTP